MATMDFQDKQIEVDDDGYLLNLDDWSKELAVELAKQDSIELTDFQNQSCVYPLLPGEAEALSEWLYGNQPDA